MMTAYITKDDDSKKEFWTQCDLPTSVLAEKVVSTIEVHLPPIACVIRMQLLPLNTMDTISLSILLC